MSAIELADAMKNVSSVYYGGKSYQCSAIIKRLINGEWKYSAELLDKSGHSVIIVRCEEVTNSAGTERISE